MKRKVNEKAHQLGALYERVFKSPDGQKVMEDLELRFNERTLKSNNGIVDPYATIFADGSRDVILHIYRMRKYNAIAE
jgi:hypothetical protein